MHIVQLTTELRLSGTEKVIVELAGSLVARGHKVTVISLKPSLEDMKQSIVPELEKLGATVISLNLTKFTPWKIPYLKSLLKKLKPDVIHAHMIHSNILSRFFSPKNTPIVNTVHTPERRKFKQWHFLLDRWTFLDKIIQTCVSQAVRDFHAAKIGVDPERLPVVYNGQRPSRKLSESDVLSLRQDWRLDNCDRILGSVGRLSPEKGYKRLLQSCVELADKIPRGQTWGLVILGEGPERSLLEGLVENIPDNLRVLLPGFRKDASQVMGAFDCFLMPSLYEGFGLTLIEAMNHGLPIVCTEVDSLPELMLHYNNGLCVPWSEFGDSILKAVDHKKVNCDVPFTAEIMTDNYLEIYKRLSI